MKKHDKYQDYVIKDGKLVGEFEQMYKDFDDPWEQSTRESYASEKALCLNLVESFKCQNVVELGCGFGQLTDRLKKSVLLSQVWTFLQQLLIKQRKDIQIVIFM
tara:strand:+ start:114 stop:425 length:312 start_codon:yes stop_codon:yes gene_type:complete